MRGKGPRPLTMIYVRYTSAQVVWWEGEPTKQFCQSTKVIFKRESILTNYRCLLSLLPNLLPLKFSQKNLKVSEKQRNSFSFNPRYT